MRMVESVIKPLLLGPRPGMCRGCDEMEIVKWDAKGLGPVCGECATMVLSAEVVKEVEALKIEKGKI